jgi:transcriptional antiterminator NusG
MIRMVKPMTRQKRWYAVHVREGQEEKVKQFLERRARELRLEEKIGWVVILKERGYYWKSPGEKSVLPGYIIVEMVLDEETWNLVRRTPGVIGFVGVQEGKTDRRGVPIVRPLSDHEVKSILRMMGETVRITGPFVDTVGRIEDELFFISRFTFYDPETFVVRVEKDERIEVGSEKERWLKERGFYKMARFGR